MSDEKSTASRSWVRSFFGGFWGQLLIACAVFGLILTFVAKPYWVPSGSMEQTLKPGDRVLVNRFVYRNSAPQAGDIIVFNAGSAWDQGSTTQRSPLKAAAVWWGQLTGFGPTGDHTLVKRIIATPGQTASCCSKQGQVIVGDHPLSEPYVYDDLPFVSGSLDCTTTPRSERCFGPVTVPKNSYLVLGDNRGDSSDSAYRCRLQGADQASCWRWATSDGVVGRVDAVIWPISRWHSVKSEH